MEEEIKKITEGNENVDQRVLRELITDLSNKLTLPCIYSIGLYRFDEAISKYRHTKSSFIR